jgi:hypothetical protein
MFAFAAHTIAQAFEEALMTPILTEAEVEFIRDDVRDAVIDAYGLQNVPVPTDANEYEVEFFDLMGYSDPVRLAPLELEF